MKNSDEYKRWLRDMESCYMTMCALKTTDDFRAIIEQAQHVVELCSKVFIACFKEPEWSHSPKDQILSIIRENGDEISKTCGEEVINKLKMLASDVEEIAPWHGKTVYGEKIDDKTWLAAVDISTEKIANWATELAERSYKTIKEFISAWFEDVN